MRTAAALVLSSAFLSALGCGDQGGGAAGDGSTSIVLQSTTLSGGLVPAALKAQAGSAPSASAQAGAPCRVTIEGGRAVEGFCTTPLRVRGTANEISVSGKSHLPTRLLGGGDQGIEGIFGYRAFDLAAGSALAGEDNIGEVETEFNELKVHWNHIETSFAAGGRFFTVRHVVFSEPIFDEDAFAGCVADPGDRERVEKAGRLFPAVNAKRGDILVCVKEHEADACADADFAWLDSETSELVKVRPKDPSRLRGEFFTTKPSCRAGQSLRESELTMPVFELRAKLASPFTLSAKFGDRGKRTYTYRDASGTKMGSTLTLTFDFAMQSSLFWESDPTKQTEAEIQKQLASVMLTPVLAANGRSTGSDGDIGAGMSVSVSASLQ